MNERQNFIVIGAQHNGTGKELHIPIIPETDTWLASSQRKWQEIDTVLETKLLSIQSSVVNSQTGQVENIGKAYGLEKSPSGNSTRFLAYVELLDEYRVARESFEKRAQLNRSIYEITKEAFNTSPGGRRGRTQRRKQIDTSYKREYNPQIAHDMQRVTEIKRIEELILRKAVMDIFSVESTEGIPQEPMIVEQFENLLDTQQVQLERTKGQLEKRKPIRYFIDTLSNYLVNSQDRGLFIRYRYRQSPDLISKVKDAEVLETILRFTANAHRTEINSEDSKLLAKLGQSYITFLESRASAQDSNIGEEYPQLSLLYDLLTAAFVTGKQDVINKTINIIDKHFVDVFQSRMVRHELVKFANKWRSLASPLYNRFRIGLIEKINPGQLPPEIYQISREERADYIVSPEFRIYIALNFAKTHFNIAKPSLFSPMRSLLEFSKQTDALIGDSIAGIDPQVEQAIEKTLILYSVSGDSRFRGIEVNLTDILFTQKSDTARKAINDLPISSKILEMRKEVQDLSSKRLDSITLENAIFTYYLQIFSKESSGENIDKENTLLWQEILDNPTWFVSPRGDRFKAENDPQLADNGIESITFTIDKNHPREHKVKIILNGIEKPLEFWLDSNRNLLGSQRQILFTDISLRESFLNMILERLYYITSGLSATETERELEDNERRLPFLYRRAHYRVLTSTPEHPITLESYGAQIHAKEIKEDYGIDIQAEIKRRRAVGTLQPNQYLTFVREVTPKEKAVLVLPNDLTFDPTLMQFG